VNGLMISGIPQCNQDHLRVRIRPQKQRYLPVGLRPFPSKDPFPRFEQMVHVVWPDQCGIQDL
jgi:hypothetical protein